MTDVRWQPLIASLAGVALLWWGAGWPVALGAFLLQWGHNLEMHLDE